jgi:hypothetical protein
MQLSSSLLLFLFYSSTSNAFTIQPQIRAKPQSIGPAATTDYFRPASGCMSQLSLAARKNDNAYDDGNSYNEMQKRIRSIILSTTYFMLLPSIIFPAQQAVYAATTVTTTTTVDEGASFITDSNIGKAVRKSAIQGARTIDNIDEKWERFSDSLRDKNKCDEATGRRLFDNGFRKDGTRIGNPVLGALCNPIGLEPLNESMGNQVLDYALNAAVVATNIGTSDSTDTDSINANNALLKQKVEKVQSLVRPSFERSIANIDEKDEVEKKRKLYNFAMYSNMKAINDELLSSSSSTSANKESMKNFYIKWGDSLVSNLAPNANRNDYSSPFTEMKDEFEDYDYDKNVLLDSLGMLNVALKSLQKDGLIGHFEIVIPYDDYGSVVTLAVDDDITLGSQLLLREQGVQMSGSFVESIVRSVMDKAKINYSLDSFFIDPSTTVQSVYNPTQLLLNLSNLQSK